MNRIGIFDYKVILVSNILERYDEARNKRFNPVNNRGFILLDKNRKNALFRNAKFEKYVIFIADIDNIIESMPQPYREVIKNRYFQSDINTFMRDFNIKSKREANKIIRRSINLFYDAIEKYKKAS